jgi:hypothetical protein
VSFFLDLYQSFVDLSTSAKSALIFTALAYVFYVVMTLVKPARPTLSTWISWLIMDGALLAGMIAKNVFAIQMYVYPIGCVAVILACLCRKAGMGWTRFDSICVALVIIAVGLWYLSGNADIAIIVSIVAILIGTLPLFWHVWEDPSVEPLTPWVLVAIGGISGVIAIQHLTIADALTPIVFGIVQVAFMILVAQKFRGPIRRWTDIVLMHD